MGGRYQAYLAYKDSGKDYYGNVPLHWSLEKIKYNSYVKGRQGWQNLRAEEYKDVGPYLVTGSHFDNEGGIDWDQCYRVSEERYNRDKDIWIKVNDVLMTKDGTIGKIAYIDDLPGQACLNSHLLIIRDFYQRYDQRFLYYLLGSSCFKGFIGERQTGTTFYGITQEAVEEFPLLICPVSEQQQIANFLDHETAKIDTLIEKQQQLIALLKEKRQAVISHAVTKGLNPDAPMKDSGVEWLGEVPEHWDVLPLKFCIKSKRGAVKAGPFGSHLKSSDMEGSDVKVINQQNVILRDFNLGDSKVSIDKYKELLSFTIYNRDVLVTTRGTIGRTAVYKSSEIAILHPCLIRIQFNQHKVSPEMAALIIQESGYVLEQILLNSNATTIEVIYTESLMNTTIVISPSLQEQKDIMRFIEERNRHFDFVINKAQRMIRLMQERRTALISAAVTGKIDVRNWQPPTDKAIQ